jgi:hypothetical protein
MSPEDGGYLAMLPTASCRPQLSEIAEHPIEISKPRGSGTCIVIRAGGSPGKNSA